MTRAFLSKINCRGVNALASLRRNPAKMQQVKNKNIVAQSSLNKEERQINISNAFEINSKFQIKKPLGNFPNDLNYNNLKIAIFDDIFTTGSTTNECAKTLKLLNPLLIGIVTIAKD